MHTVTAQSIQLNNSCQTRYVSKESSIEIALNGQIGADDLAILHQSIEGLMRILPVRTLVVNCADNIKQNLGLIWKIVESAWEPLHSFGGEKIVFTHHNSVPSFVKTTYTNAVKNYAIPIKVEFESANS